MRFVLPYDSAIHESFFQHFQHGTSCTFFITDHLGRTHCQTWCTLAGIKFHVLIDHTFQMMFVSGETADVAPETTSMIEFIVQQQVMEMVSPHTLTHMIF